jgi:mono/diheme cytochrome c family protein
MRCFGVAALLALVTSSVAAHDPITTTVTYAREVRAIVGTRCVTCHAPGGSAPMPLTTYEETRPWARAIKEQVLTRRMPKWHAARGFGAFANDPTLTPFEIALLVSWIDGGLPRDTRSSVAGATAPRSPLPRRHCHARARRSRGTCCPSRCPREWRSCRGRSGGGG